MTNFSENQYFILIKKKKILFHALNSDGKDILVKKIPINDYSNENVINLIKNFLDNNIFEIENNLKNFIKEIYIIFESELFFDVTTSIKSSLDKTSNTLYNINDSLIEIRNQFKKYSPNDEIIHMIINKYEINNKDYQILPENVISENLIVQINFICLKDYIIKDLKKIFSEYQISLKKILSYNYLKGIEYDGSNVIDKAKISIHGLHKNEVLITNKSPKNLPFFEKFFNFFS